LTRTFERFAGALDERVLGHADDDDIVFFHGCRDLGDHRGVKLRELFGSDGRELVCREARSHARKGSTR
jgi:hypothetical protein